MRCRWRCRFRQLLCQRRSPRSLPGYQATSRMTSSRRRCPLSACQMSCGSSWRRTSARLCRHSSPHLSPYPHRQREVTAGGQAHGSPHPSGFAGRRRHVWPEESFGRQMWRQFSAPFSPSPTWEQQTCRSTSPWSTQTTRSCTTKAATTRGAGALPRSSRPGRSPARVKAAPRVAGDHFLWWIALSRWRPRPTARSRRHPRPRDSNCRRASPPTCAARRRIAWLRRPESVCRPTSRTSDRL
mmetsp:Transcript_1664/g.4320  ORF Transcript_1664/g.4320 Transcript_1664/m.4320 type:complete len:241 (-) Transcript_1664:363-1085(-)